MNKITCPHCNKSFDGSEIIAKDLQEMKKKEKIRFDQENKANLEKEKIQRNKENKLELEKEKIRINKGNKEKDKMIKEL